MKTLNTYKNQYLKAKTQKGKKIAMNKAMLNLSYSDQQEFIKWQTNQMNQSN
jgi:hypothetical protein